MAEKFLSRTNFGGVTEATTGETFYMFVFDLGGMCLTNLNGGCL